MPLARSEWKPSVCSDRTRSAPTALASSARCSSLAPLPGPRVSQVCTPSAFRRPSSRDTRSQTSSASTRPSATTPVSLPPCPASSTMRLPSRLGPASATATMSRRSCGRPPTTRRPSWRSARIVAGPADPVGHQPVVTLEAAQRVGGQRPEDAVGPGQGVAELEQLGLQGRDVVTGQRLAGLVRQHAVAQAPVGAGQRGEGLRADRAVDRQAPPLLEMAHRELGGLVEEVGLGGVGVVEQADGGEHGADLGDCAAGGTATQWLHQYEGLAE